MGICQVNKLFLSGQYLISLLLVDVRLTCITVTVVVGTILADILFTIKS